MTAFDPNANYCADCGVRLDALDKATLCEPCREKADGEDYSPPDDAPESVPSSWWAGGFASNH